MKTLFFPLDSASDKFTRNRQQTVKTVASEYFNTTSLFLRYMLSKLLPTQRRGAATGRERENLDLREPLKPDSFLHFRVKVLTDKKT
jgi:hypothetical protein